MTVQFALFFKEHMEQLTSSYEYLDRLAARSYKAKKNDCVIL